jgi:NAD(P)-dependent dehydrogenase (short-subunit alcohol dehydrogenase family)
MNRRDFLYRATLAALVAHPFASLADSACGPGTTAEAVTAGLDLSGKTAVITGCNSGIGLETMRVLALRGAHVIGTARTLEKGQQACAHVKGRTTAVVLELSDFDSVVACAESIRKLNVDIDMLILNAGITTPDWRAIDGIEQHFLVNHLGHFLLTQRLLDRVTAAGQGRVVVVGSGNHRNAPEGGIQFNDLEGRTWRKGYAHYAHSKLANGLFSLELSKRLRGTRATSNCLSPGAVDTNIRRHVSKDDWPDKLKSVAEGAATVCYVAAHPNLAEVTGEYFSNCGPAPQSAYQKDAAMAKKLWDVSTELTRKYLT